MYSSAVFTGVDLFALKFYLDRVVLVNHSWHQKTRDTGLPDDENRIPLRSFFLTQYENVMDRQIVCFKYMFYFVCFYCTAAFVA